MKALTTLLVVGMFLMPVAMADDADDVEAVVREHFATLNAGNQDAHLQQHHMAQYNRFTTGGLRWHFDSIEEQQQQIHTAFDSGREYNLSLRDVEVTVYGNSAVLSCYIVGSIGLATGNRELRRDRYSATLIKQSGQWKAVHAHTSPLRITVPQ